MFSPNNVRKATAKDCHEAQSAGSKRQIKRTPALAKLSGFGFGFGGGGGDNLQDAAEDDQELTKTDGFIEVSPDVHTHLSGPERLSGRLGELDSRNELVNDREEWPRNNQRKWADSRRTAEALAIQRRQQKQQLQQLQQRQRDFGRPGSFELSLGGATYAAQQHSARTGFNQRDHTGSPSKLINLQRAAEQLRAAAPADRTASFGDSTSSDFITTTMYLDNTMPLEVESDVGGIAYLVCRLRSIQQQLRLQVSWVRNMQILTSGELRYTSDERFKPTHLAGTHDWVLEIHNVNANDEGPYECQVNSEPKAVSVSLYLHVIAVTLEIAEGTEVQVAEDEQIKLTCRVEFDSEAERQNADEAGQLDEPVHAGQAGASKSLRATTARRPLSGRFSSQHYIYWYKDNVSLEYNNPRGGIKVELRENASNLEKKLIIENAQVSDSGNYMCKLLPELSEVPPAQARLAVGGPSLSVSSGSASGFPLTRAVKSAAQENRIISFPISGLSAVTTNALLSALVVVVVVVF